jgi:type II secretory pathway component PulF
VILTPGQLNRRAELYYQLGSMISAGVPLMQALEMAGRSASLRGSRKSISEILGHMQNGLTFSDAMLQVQGWLPEFDTAMLAAGEQAGRLDFSFKSLGEYYATRALIIRDTISSLLLPAVNLHVFLLVFPLGFLIGMAMGIINNDYRLCIRFIVEKVLVYGGLWGLIVFFIFACQGKRGERWRSLLEHLNQSIPMLRRASKYLVLFRFTVALDALVNSGISIVKSLPMAASASGSPHLKRRLSEWPAQLTSGITPAELVREDPYFPEMFANLYHTGEISGQIDDTLKRLQIYYREEGFRVLKMFMRILSATIYGLIALMIAYNVISFWTHYYGGLSGGQF